jgi:hypothetical protein
MIEPALVDGLIAGGPRWLDRRVRESTNEAAS